MFICLSDLGHCSHRWGWSLSTGWLAWSRGHCEWSSAGWTRPRCRRLWSQRWWVNAGSQTSYFGILSMFVWAGGSNGGRDKSWHKQKHTCRVHSYKRKQTTIKHCSLCGPKDWRRQFSSMARVTSARLRQRLVLIQMAVITAIKSRRSMDGGREGITSMSNIPLQHSGRDHRDLETQRQQGAEQREQKKKNGWKWKNIKANPTTLWHEHKCSHGAKETRKRK